MRAKASRGRELRELLEALVEPTAEEDGFVDYDLHQAVDDPTSFHPYENRTSEAALEAHLRTPHLQHLVSVKDDLLDADDPVLDTLERIARGATVSEGGYGDPDVRVVAPDQRDPGTAQTPGLQRFAVVVAVPDPPHAPDHAR